MVKKETYKEYKVRKGITNAPQASVILGLDAMKLLNESFKEARRITEIDKNK